MRRRSGLHLAVLALVSASAWAFEEGEACDLSAETSARILAGAPEGLADRFRWGVATRDTMLVITLTYPEGLALKQRTVSLPSSCAAAAEVASVVILSWMSELPFVPSTRPTPARPPRPPRRATAPPEEPPVAPAAQPPEAPPPVEPPPPAVVHEPPPAPAPVPPAVSGRWPLRLALELQTQWADSLRPAAALRFDLGELWGAFIELSGAWPRSASLGVGTVNWQRTSLVLGPRVRAGWGIVFLEGAAGVGVTVLTAWGQGYDVDRGRVGPGFAASARLHFGLQLGRVDLHLGGSAGLAPADRAQVSGAAESLAIPRFALAASLGLAWKLAP